MLDNGISVPPASKFSRHLSADPLHDPYFIQSVGSPQPPSPGGWLWPGGEMFDYGVSNLARVWQWRDEVCKARWHFNSFSSPVSGMPAWGRPWALVGKGRPCTLNSPCCYPSLVHLKWREEEVSYRSQYYDLSDQTWIFVDSEGFPPSSEQTPDTSVTQLKYVSWHERLILPCWAVLDLSLQRKLSSLGKLSNMVKPLGCWHFMGFISHLYLCAVGSERKL